jgi:uncharacterized protein YunC (DUF1805 family)
MVEMTPIPLARGTALGITVRLPRTTLIIAATELGYVMCGALDVRLLDERLRARGIVAARVLGVHSLDDLLDAGIDDLTAGAAALGLERGMSGREALERMLAVAQVPAP